MPEDSDYIYEFMQVVTKRRPRAPKGWRCMFCAKGDTKRTPAYEYDFSTTSAQKLTFFHHPKCIQKHWEEEWRSRPDGIYGGAI